MPYNTHVIRELLSVGFGDQELVALCFDDFRPVYDQFTADMGLGIKIQLLIEHCDRQERFDDLLDRIRELNLIQYNRYIAKIDTPPQEPDPGDDLETSQVEVVLRGDSVDIPPQFQRALAHALADDLGFSRATVRIIDAYNL